jgi:hypothetical protein
MAAQHVFRVHEVHRVECVVHRSLVVHIQLCVIDLQHDPALVRMFSFVAMSTPAQLGLPTSVRCMAVSFTG